MKKKNPLRGLIYLIILVFLIGLGGLGYFNFLKSPVDSNGKVQAFVVAKGETASDIASRLEKKGLIRSAMVFKYVYKQNPNAKIEAGDFKLSPAMSVNEIISNLEKGAVDRWVTLLEGWRVEEMANKLNQELGIDKKEFLAAAKEGYMFPDTYLFNKDATAETIASILENTFDTRYTDDLKQKISAKGLTATQGVILASIVEREARSDEVRTKVASILLKRFKIGMVLNADATVRYAKDTQDLKAGKKIDKFWQAISQDDYQSVVSPYNTYLHAGLPPGPICNPSLSSLKAVANADSSTPYLFYYHDSAGNSYYATTLEEHNRNVSLHR